LPPTHARGGVAMKLKAVGFDLAKAVFQVHGVDEQDRAVLGRQLKRSEVLGFFARLEPCLVGMEACGSAHYWARKLTTLGHTVRLIAPKYVKAYVKTERKVTELGGIKSLYS